MATIVIKPHQIHESALDALDGTLKALHRGGALVRDADGKVELDAGGYVRAEVADPGFVVFAVKNQGYALEAFVLPSVSPL